MPWKMENDSLVVQDGKPVYIYPETAGKDFAGKEVPFDADLATSKISGLNAESKDWRTKYESLKPWEGLTVDDKPVELEEARTAIQTVRNLKDGKLVEADRVQGIRDEEKRRYEGEITKRDTEIGTLRATVDQKDIAHAFALSEFVKKKLDLPAVAAIKLFGHHAKKDDKGNVIFEFKGETIRSKKNYTEPADVDEALEFIVDNDPQRDRWLRTDGAGGSGASASGGARGKGGSKVKSRSEFMAMSPDAQMKWVTTDGGTVKD